jgi:hypothetical protein
VNAGFSNLADLKNQLLAGTVKNDIGFNDLILTLGQGVAEQFELFTNRKFCYLTGAQEVFPADRAEFCLSRFPIVAVTLAEKKRCEEEGFFALPAKFIRIIDQANGIIHHGECDAGRYHEQIRFTFNAGYYWNTAEPKDAVHPSPWPAGASPLPKVLLEAWFLQCRHIWKNIDKLGTDLLSDGAIKSLRFPEDFAPTVDATLYNYKRFNLV